MSKQVSGELKIFRPALKVSPRDYFKLQLLSGRVITFLTGNANFPTPNPSVASLTTALGALTAKINANGSLSRRRRGGKVNNVALITAAKDLFDLLSAELGYVVTTVGGQINNANVNVFLSSGFQIGDIRNLTKTNVRPATFFKQLNTATNPSTTPVVKFRKPNGGIVLGKRVKGYKIFNVTAPNTAGYPMFVTATKFSPVNMPANMRWEFKIVAVSSNGNGLAQYVTAVSGNP